MLETKQISNTHSSAPESLRIFDLYYVLSSLGFFFFWTDRRFVDPSDRDHSLHLKNRCLTSHLATQRGDPNHIT